MKYFIIFLYFAIINAWDGQCQNHTHQEQIYTEQTVKDSLEQILKLISIYDPEAHKNPHIFDIGARYGYFSLMSIQYFPNAFLDTFEPNPEQYYPMKKAMKQYNGTITKKLSVNEVPGYMLHFLKYDTETQERSTLLITNATTVDTWMQDIPFVFFLKISTSKTSPAILAGSILGLNSKSIKYIFFEYDPERFAIQNTLQILADNHYKIYQKVDEYYINIRMECVAQVPISNTIYFAMIEGLSFEKNIMRRLCPLCGY